jgi:LPS-assembly protein
LKRCFCLLFFILCLLIGGSFSFAGDANSLPWEITADRMTRQLNPQIVIGEGNVVMQRIEGEEGRGLVLKADWVEYNVDKGTVNARGNLSMQSAKENVVAEEAALNLYDETATLTETTLYIPDSNLHFTGGKAEKTGPITYHFENGSFTTCPLEEGKSPPWRFSSVEATVKTEGVTVLKHTVLRVKDIPVLYSPYLAFPVYQKRKTGFLLPEFSQSNRNGTGLITPYFVNLSPSTDITLYPGYLARRGMTAGVEARYVADYGSQGTFAVSYQYDRTEDDAGDDYKDDGYYRTEQNRYWIRGKIDHDFGNNLIARLDVDLVSDRDFLQEFESSILGFDESNRAFLHQFNRGLEEQTLPYRSSTYNISKTFRSSFLGGQVIGIDDNDLENDVVDGKNITVIHTLPQIVFDGVMNIPKSDLHLTWNGNYVNYWRDQGIGEHRLDLHPRLVSPLPVGRFLEGTLSAGIRETLYSIDDHGSQWDWDSDASQYRTAWDVKGEIATTLARDFQGDFGPYSWINHAIRPELEYEYTSVNNDDVLPEIDSVDTLTRSNLFRYSLNNYFRAGGTDEKGDFFQHYLGYFEIEQSYDVREARRDKEGPEDKRRPFSDIALTLNVHLLPRWQLKYETDYSVYGKGFTRYDLYSRYTSKRGNMFFLEYRHEEDTEISEINAALQAHLTNTVYLEGDITHSLHIDETVRSSIGIVYHPGCWAIELRAEDTPDDDRLMLMFSLVGLGETLGIGLSSDFGENGVKLSSGAGDIDIEENRQ